MRPRLVLELGVGRKRPCLAVVAVYRDVKSNIASSG